jgi:hypothetical protein
LASIHSAPAQDVGSSHVAKSTPQRLANMSQHIPARLFSTPPAIDPSHTRTGSTPIAGDREHDIPLHPEVAEPHAGSGGTGSDDTVSSFPRSSRVASTGTISCTFLVNEKGVTIKTLKCPGVFNCFNHLLLYICVTPCFPQFVKITGLAKNCCKLRNVNM